MSAAPLLDALGCLTESGWSALSNSPPGRVPAEIVAHLGRCARCQERTLALAAGRSLDAPRVKKRPPPLWRTAVVIIAMLLLVVSAMMMLSQVR